MASFKNPDPELLPIGRPRCPACTMRMITVDITPKPEGFEHRTFECLRWSFGENDSGVRSAQVKCDRLASRRIEAASIRPLMEADG